MYNFTFHRPTTVRQAAGLLARNPEGKLLAGGHELDEGRQARRTITGRGAVRCGAPAGREGLVAEAVPVVEHEHGEVGEGLGPGDGDFPGEGVAMVHREHEGVVADGEGS